MNQSRNKTVNPTEQEPLLTLKAASVALNIPYRQLLLEVAAGRFPFYQVGKSRRMVLASEILTSMRYQPLIKETKP